MTERVVLNFGRGLVLAVAAWWLAVAAPNVLGQGNAAPSAATEAATTDVRVPAFDVVSVKQNKSESRMVRVMNKSDGYAATNVSLKMLLQGAYGIREDLISGAPGWADSAAFDIDAKVADADVDALKNLKAEQRRLMLQPLLADRFHLKAHTETRLLPVYELTLAKGGSKLKEATPGNTYANGIKGFDGVGRAGMMRMGRGEVTGQAIAVSGMVNMLSRQLQRTVIDKTGLTGKYDFTLQWTEESSDPMFKGGDNNQQRAEPAPDATGPSIFTALQEQLGLKLQSAKGPVETLVIDHVEMPSEN
ncbi:MAG: TIGR03435 family protein [Edaphobacter sp.]